MNDPLNDLWTSSAPALDVDALAQRAATSRARQKWLFVLEAASTAIVLLFWGVVLFTSPSPVVIALATASGVALAFWWRFLLKNQRGTWSSSSLTAMAFLDLERKRLQAANRHARTTMRVVCGIAGLLLLTMPLLWRFVPVYRDEPWRLGVAALIACAIVVVTLVQTAVRARTNEKVRIELEGADGRGWE